MNVQLTEELEEKLELMVKSMEAREPVHFWSLSSRLRIRFGDSSGAEAVRRRLRQCQAGGSPTYVGKIYEEFAPLLRKEGKLTVEE